MRQNDQGAEPRKERHVVERANIDEAQFEACIGDEADLHASLSADKQHFRTASHDQFIGHGKGWNNVAAGSAAGDEDAKFH